MYPPLADVPPNNLERRREQQIAGRRDAAADRHDIGVEGVDRVGDADADAPPDKAQQADRDLVPGPRRAHEVRPGDRPVLLQGDPDRGGRVRGRRLARQPVERVAGGEGFERPRLGEVVGRGGYVVLDADQRVTDLRRGAGRAAVGTPCDHDTAADSGADRQHHKILDVEVASLVVRFGERRDRRVVVDEYGNAQLVLEDVAQRHVLERDVDRRADHAGRELDDRRDPDADRGERVLAGAIAHAVEDLGDNVLGARQVGRAELRLA